VNKEDATLFYQCQNVAKETEYAFRNWRSWNRCLKTSGARQDGRGIKTLRGCSRIGSLNENKTDDSCVAKSVSVVVSSQRCCSPDSGFCVAKFREFVVNHKLESMLVDIGSTVYLLWRVSGRKYCFTMWRCSIDIKGEADVIVHVKPKYLFKVYVASCTNFSFASVLRNKSCECKFGLKRINLEKPRN